MAISEVFADSASISTSEYFVAGDSTSADYQTADGVYQLWLDLSAVVAGDIFTIRVYEKVGSAGTARVVLTDSVTGPLESPHYVTPSLILMHGWEFSLIRNAGSDRTIAWSVRKIA
jgi:hypothetical protein